MDIPFLLGTAFTANRLYAKALGYVLIFAIGQFFALLYYAIFLAIGLNGWWLGAIFGLVHGLAVTTALINDLPPLIHPRMGSPMTAANSTALLEPPGFSWSTTAREHQSSTSSPTSPTAQSSAASSSSPADKQPREGRLVLGGPPRR